MAILNSKAKLFLFNTHLLFFHLLLLICLLLFPCSKHVVSHYLIESLPGFQGPLPFEFETGYIGVDESEDVQLFYYFVKSESNPKEDPLLLWLTGGPGCSSFSAFAYELGPLSFGAVQKDESTPTLILNPLSWSKHLVLYVQLLGRNLRHLKLVNDNYQVASIIFVDLPVGTGFSYARTSNASKSTDLQACDQAYQFLRKWFLDHPEFLPNPFYVAGDSYSGITVPIIAQIISNGNEAGNEPPINLKGYVLGNPKTNSDLESNSVVPFAHGMGLISDELYESLQKNCQGQYSDVDPSNAQCLQDVQAYSECTKGLAPGYILGPRCDFASPNPWEFVGKRRSLDEGNMELGIPEQSVCASGTNARHRLSYRWLNDDSVREALHIRKGSIGAWIRCNYGVAYDISILNTFQYHVNLSTKGYRSLIYSGDQDMLVPFLATQAWIRSLNYSVIDDWRSWRVGGQVAGYTRTYSNQMTFATVKGAGHVAPEYKPLECSAMFKRWISHQPL